MLVKISTKPNRNGTSYQLEIDTDKKPLKTASLYSLTLTLQDYHKNK